MSFLSGFLHFTYPAESNNFRARILHPSGIAVITAFFLAFQVLMQFVSFSGVRVLGYAASISPEVVVSLTNKKRLAYGLSELKSNPILEQAARAKGLDMLDKDYWAHIAPDGTEPWAFFINAGYDYRYAGENLARDFSNPVSAVEAWMASPSHRENILSSKYKEIGVAVVEGDLNGVDTTIIVQLFGTSLEDKIPTIPVAFAQETVATPEPATVPEVSFSSSEGLLPSGNKLRISPFSSTKMISLVVTLALLVIMAVDLAVVSRNKVSRMTGKPFAHISFLGMILVIILIVTAGQIL